MLLFGGSGLLGTKIKELLSKNFAIAAPFRSKVNLEVRADVEKIIEEINPDVIVYAAGVTNVDWAEKNREYSMKINKDAISWIVKRAAFNQIPVIYFSTDAVFKGDKSESPYKETDTISPINYYGFTKAKGEDCVLSVSEKNLVIRLINLYTSFFSGKPDFARNILDKLSRKERCFGIVDQLFNPTFSNDAVRGLSDAIDKKISGILHLGATDYLTNYNFTQEIAYKFGYAKSAISPITLSDFFKGKRAKRAKYTWLDVAKAQKIFGQNLLHTNNQNLEIFHAKF